MGGRAGKQVGNVLQFRALKGKFHKAVLCDFHRPAGVTHGRPEGGHLRNRKTCIVCDNHNAGITQLAVEGRHELVLFRSFHLPSPFGGVSAAGLPLPPA